MFIKHRGFVPVTDPSVFVAPTAVLAGKVKVGKDSRIMYGTVLDAEGSRVEVGECTVICENAVIRATAEGDKDHPVLIEDHVFVGPHATLLGCTVEQASYIATGATILQGAIVRSCAIIAVGALVHANAAIPKGMFLSPNTVALGEPVRLYGPHEKEALVDAIRSVGFTKTAFNVATGGADPVERLKRTVEVKSRELGGHFNDEMSENR
jgi:carbonic anhydrase/acetyltransferase-like protein (isoleucine patch superfamily)